MMHISKITSQWCEKKQILCQITSETESTNAQAKSSKTNEDLQVFVTGHQTSGKGRGSNSWLNAEADSGLLTSWMFQLNEHPQHITSPLFGLALYRAANLTWPNLQWSLKAPNDLYLKDKKVAGLLIENLSHSQSDQLIVGLGMNLLAHPVSIETATHLDSENGLDGALSKREIFSFLDHLLNEFSQAKGLCTKPSLAAKQQQELLTALNANPNKKETFISMSENGDLATQNSIISWKDL